MRTGIKLIIVGIFVVLALPLCAQQPFALIQVDVNRTSYRGACPVTIEFTAKIHLQSVQKGFTYTYSWTRNNGTKGPVQTMHPQISENGPNIVLLKDKWKFGSVGDVGMLSETLHLNSGKTHAEQSSQIVRINCM